MTTDAPTTLHRLPGDDPDRLATMAEMLSRGLSLEEIGLQFGITRERVRQILSAAGYDTGRSRTARTHMQRVNLDTEIRVTIEKSPDQHLTTSEIARAVGVSPARVRERVRAMGLEGRIITSSRVAPHRTYTDEDIANALRAAAAAAGSNSVSARIYSTYRKANPDKRLPSEPLIVRRFPSWSDACVYAGLEPHEERPGGYVRKFDPDRMAEDVALYLRSCVESGERSSARGYTAWARENHALTFSTIALNLGSAAWSKARAAGFAKMIEQESEEAVSDVPA